MRRPSATARANAVATGANALALAFALAFAFAFAFAALGSAPGAALAQRPGGGVPGEPPPAAMSGQRPDSSRDGLDADPDPVGAIIERRGLLALSNAQFAALRDLRRWHQRSVRVVRDSLGRMGVPLAEPPRGGGTPPGSPTPAATRTPGARPLLDSLRLWTTLARDSARALLTPAQRDTLAALWTRYRDSLPARGRPPRGRPPA